MDHLVKSLKYLCIRNERESGSPGKMSHNNQQKQKKMNKVCDNNGNEMKIGKGMEEWNYIEKMIDDNDFNCTVHIELDITKVEDENGDIWLVAKDETGIIDERCLYEKEVMSPGEHYHCDLDEVLAMMIGEYRTIEPFPEELRQKIREMNPTLNLFSNDIKANESMK